MNQATQIIPFTTSGSLVDYVDRKVIVVLRDGKKLIGILRSFDQFANLMLQYTIERIYVDDMYGDIDRGVYIVRGENVVLLGELVSFVCNSKYSSIFINFFERGLNISKRIWIRSMMQSNNCDVCLLKNCILWRSFMKKRRRKIYVRRASTFIL